MLTNVTAGGIKCVEILCIENKVGVWEQSPHPPEADRDSGAPLPRRCGNFRDFFQKISIF